MYKKGTSRGDLDFIKRNPILTAPQYGLMQAAASGVAHVKGISQELAEEMIHRTPSKLRSKFAAQLAKIRASRNPSDEEDIREAELVSEEWHGRKPKEVVEITEIEKYDSVGAILADLEELGVLGTDLSTRYTITFKSDRPKLCSDLKKDNLEIVGGDQKIDIDIEANKNKVPLGYCYSIVYETDKHHLEGSNGYPESYEHFFGEEYYKSCGYDQGDYDSAEDFFDDLLENGIVEDAIAEGYLPIATYDRKNEKLSLVGGRYSIEDVGIKD